jgi:hypothetical protein
MTGWFEYSILLGASTVLTIILKKLKCKYYDNGVAVEMIVEVAMGGGFASPYTKIFNL